MNCNEEQLHELLTPEFPDHRLQNKEYQTPSKGRFTGVPPSVCAPSASPAPRWCQQEAFGECRYFLSPGDFAFHHTFLQVWPLRKRHRIFCVCWERCYKCLLSKPSRQTNYPELFIFLSLSCLKYLGIEVQESLTRGNMIHDGVKYCQHCTPLFIKLSNGVFSVCLWLEREWSLIHPPSQATWNCFITLNFWQFLLTCTHTYRQ